MVWWRAVRRVLSHEKLFKKNFRKKLEKSSEKYRKNSEKVFSKKSEKYRKKKFGR
jgi:hypothetical protein